jgi:hypothetical protein
MIPTAKEYLQFLVDELGLSLNEYHMEVISARMKGFAKLHVKESLKESYKKALIEKNGEVISKEKPNDDLVPVWSMSINEDSILNSYPLDNIK